MAGINARPFDQMLKDAVRRRFDVLMVWSIDRLGRSVLHVANALAELDAAGVALYSDQQAIDSTTPSGRAMIQMASVFGEQERQIIRSRVNAGLDRVRAQGKNLGRPKGVGEDRGRHQEASERRQRHPQGASAGWMRQWHRAASEAGDGREAGDGFSVVILPSFLDRSDRPVRITRGGSVRVTVWILTSGSCCTLGGWRVRH
jgi:DNA invertase Pin-like site-specific DNA recombinase